MVVVWSSRLGVTFLPVQNKGGSVHEISNMHTEERTVHKDTSMAHQCAPNWK